MKCASPLARIDEAADGTESSTSLTYFHQTGGPSWTCQIRWEMRRAAISSKLVTGRSVSGSSTPAPNTPHSRAGRRGSLIHTTPLKPLWPP